MTKKMEVTYIYPDGMTIKSGFGNLSIAMIREVMAGVMDPLQNPGRQNGMSYTIKEVEA
jgi:hypothetical protein